MSVLNAASDDETPDCPLCMEMFELDDLNFYPCACGYQICRFCWNKILTEAEGGQGRCPACRSPYSENTVDFKPLSTEEVAKIKAEKRQKDQARKQRVSENRKHLANVRVVQKNLVFVVGLAPRLADPEVLKKPEYFGKFGKIHKVVINHSTSYAGNQNQGPSASAYVTYYKSDDALRAIQAVNNIFIEGRTLKASLGTTKYCSHFMKNQVCPKHDCMYLHELGDEMASFTKEQMQQGKHTEYERSLHDEMGPPTDYPISSREPGSDGDSLPSDPPQSGSSSNNNNDSHWSQEPDGAPVSPSPGAQTDSRSSSPKETWPHLAGDGVPLRPQDQADSWPGASLVPDDGANGPSSLGDSPSRSVSPPLDLGDDKLPDMGQDIEDTLHPPTGPLDLGNVNRTPETNHWGGMSGGSPIPFDEEDLGFDPFELSQKALAAEMMQESQNNTSQPPNQPPTFENGLHLSRASSGAHPNEGSLFLGGHHHPSSSSSVHSPLLSGGVGGSMSQLRTKAPPPGFSLNSLSSNMSMTGSNRFNGRSGFDPFGNHVGGLGSLGGSHSFPNLPPDLDLVSNLDANQLGLTSHSRLNPAMPNLHLGNRSRGHNSSSWQQNKDWQDGLRALLPNVNVSFGPSNSFMDGTLHSRAPPLPGFPLRNNSASSTNSGLSMSQSREDATAAAIGRHRAAVAGHPVTTARQHSWHPQPPSSADWTALDPAIVTGQMGQKGLTGMRPESPPNWIKANLEQLTSDSNSPFGMGGRESYESNGMPLLSGFSGLSLGNSGLGNTESRISPSVMRHGNHPPSLGQWGNNGGSSSTPPPPPGFSSNMPMKHNFRGGNANHHDHTDNKKS